MQMVVDSPLTFAPYAFTIVTACTFQSVGPVLLYFFKTFQTFGLRVSFSLALG